MGKWTGERAGMWCNVHLWINGPALLSQKKVNFFKDFWVTPPLPWVMEQSSWPPLWPWVLTAIQIKVCMQYLGPGCCLTLTVPLRYCWVPSQHYAHGAADRALGSLQCWDITSNDYAFPPKGRIYNENGMSLSIGPVILTTSMIGHMLHSWVRQARPWGVYGPHHCPFPPRTTHLCWQESLQSTDCEEAVRVVNLWWVCLLVWVFPSWYQVFDAACSFPWWDLTSWGRQGCYYWWHLLAVHLGPSPTHEQVAIAQFGPCCWQCHDSQGGWDLWAGWGTWCTHHLPPCIFARPQPNWASIFIHQGLAACKPLLHQCWAWVQQWQHLQCPLGGCLFLLHCHGTLALT